MGASMISDFEKVFFNYTGYSLIGLTKVSKASKNDSN
jgi:hypothetical protein